MLLTRIPRPCSRSSSATRANASTSTVFNPSNTFTTSARPRSSLSQRVHGPNARLSRDSQRREREADASSFVDDDRSIPSEVISRTSAYAPKSSRADAGALDDIARVEETPRAGGWEHGGAVTRARAMSPTTTSKSASEEEEEEEERASNDAVDALVERVGALDVREAPKTDEVTTGAVGHVLVLVGVDPDAKTRTSSARSVRKRSSADRRSCGWGRRGRAPRSRRRKTRARATSEARRNRWGAVALLRWEKGKKEVSDVNISELAPPKARPRANASVARRMIANALNVKLDDAATRPSAEKRKRKVMLEKRGLRRSDERENVFLVKVLNSF